MPRARPTPAQRVETRRVLGRIAGAGLALVAACNCNDATAPAQRPAAQGDGEEESMADHRSTIKKKVAEIDEVPESEVTLTRFEEPTPGLFVFQAETPGAIPDRGPEYTFGVLAGGRVEVRNAIELVAEVWGYDESRPVPAVTVAKVFGLLGSDIEPHRPLLEEKDLDKVHERHRDLVALPRETTVDGRPAVQYWETSPREPFLMRVTAVFQPDSTVAFQVEEANALLAEEQE